jgi:hypothetical protein
LSSESRNTHLPEHGVSNDEVQVVVVPLSVPELPDEVDDDDELDDELVPLTSLHADAFDFRTQMSLRGAGHVVQSAPRSAHEILLEQAGDDSKRRRAGAKTKPREVRAGTIRGYDAQSVREQEKCETLSQRSLRAPREARFTEISRVRASAPVIL